MAHYDGTYAAPGETVDLRLVGAPEGLEGDVALTLIDAETGLVAVARTTANITELGGGIYRHRAPAPAAGQYVPRWDIGNPAVFRDDTELLIVNLTGAPADVTNDAIATLAELRALEPLDDDTKYPDELVLATRDAVIDALEDACRTSFVRRPYTETFDDPVPMAMLNLERRRNPVVTALTVNAVELTAGEVTGLRAARGLVSRPYGGFGNTAVITYEQGYNTPPGRVRRAVRLLTRDWLAEEVSDTIPARATSWSAGENTYRLVTAGVAGAIFDLPEANAVVKQYRE